MGTAQETGDGTDGWMDPRGVQTRLKTVCYLEVFKVTPLPSLYWFFPGKTGCPRFPVKTPVQAWQGRDFLEKLQKVDCFVSGSVLPVSESTVG